LNGSWDANSWDINSWDISVWEVSGWDVVQEDVSTWEYEIVDNYSDSSDPFAWLIQPIN
jgi:hypothetical protein